LPAQISIEARDNDPVGGSKWGKSAVITIVPTAVGELEALRYLALIRARDRFVDAAAIAAESLPARLPAEPSKPASTSASRAEQAAQKAAQKAAAAERLQRFDQALEGAASDFEQALDESYGGLRVAPGLRNFALGRLRLLRALKGTLEQRARSVEDLALALDGVLASMSNRDAQRVAKILGNVAEEAMVGAQQAQSGESPAPGIDRLDKAIYALHAGAEQLLSLGVLGNDLGSVALADLGRVSSARQASDYYHAELAARHLAERLHRPVPSFGAQGSGGGGVEAGQGEGSSEPQPGQGAQGQRSFDDLADQIAELARQHAGAVEQVDQTLSGAQQTENSAALHEEAERRAKEIRDAVTDLPEPGSSPGTAEAAGSLARESGRGMAQELEGLKLEQAAESARRALSALSDARAKSEGHGYFQGQLDRARAVIEEHQRWLQEQLETQREQARERTRGLLQGPMQLENELANKAQELSRRGEDANSPLPGEVTERLRQAEQLMQQAARELSRGEGEAGLSLQRDAQRLLESADQGKTSDPDQSQDDKQQQEAGDEEGNGRAGGFSGDVPKAEQQNRAEEFRKRVLRSLGDSSEGHLAPAVKRYAEGLLR